MAVEYKVVEPRPRIRFSVNGLPVTLVTLLHPYEGETPDVDMERLSLSEDNQKKGVLGLHIKAGGEEHVIFFAPEGCEFSYRGSELRGPVSVRSAASE